MKLIKEPMAKETTVLTRQSLADICVQTLGGISAWFELAWANNIGITDELTAGHALQTGSVDMVATDIVDFYAVRNIKPATSLTATDLTALEGIGYWVIQNDFKIQAI